MSEQTAAAAPPAVVAPPPAPVVEAPPPKPAPVEVPAEVLQREKAIRSQQQALAKEKADLAAQRTEYEAWKAQQAKAAIESADPLEQLKATRGAVETLQQRLEAQAKEAQAKENARELASWREKQVAHVQANPEKYELTLLGGHASAVPARIESHYAATGEMLTTEQAAEAIEKEIEAALEKAASSKKWKAKTAKAVEAPPASTGEAAGSSAIAPKTLTNSLTAAATTVAPGVKKLSREERIKRLMETPWSAPKK